MTRTRICDSGPCIGEDTDEVVCNLQDCPQDGVWEEWQAWVMCSLTCGGGTQVGTLGMGSGRSDRPGPCVQ